MSDRGEKKCSLCAERMDLTDQRLKPCKCGYETFGHLLLIVDYLVRELSLSTGTAMLSYFRTEQEGRCPACCTPYDKEKFVAMASICGRLVPEVSVDRKKSQKARSKPCKVRQLLGSVRVIQWNVVHIPLTMADEDLLQRKDSFGLYGRFLCRGLLLGMLRNHKILSCLAEKCAHKVLQAENVITPYYHLEIRVQHITGVIINMQTGSGNGLPLPVDGCGSETYASSAKPAAKALQM
ncbi:General negative regulator of transcription subunit 4-like protein [Drosera capensis]